MKLVDDRLSRISALRPPERQGAIAGPMKKAPKNSGKLVRMLNGTIRKNDLGSHLLVCRLFDTPKAGKADPRGLALILPETSGKVCDTGQWLFLDTETTGLAGGTGTYAFLVGVGWWESGRFVVEQYFMRDHSEESSLLRGLMDRLEQRPILVTYNGKSYDWPLLQTRFRLARLKIREPLAHIDLLYPARRLWRLRLKSVALTRLETHVLGFNRERDIPSETIPQLYFNFLRGAPEDGIADVFHHNSMDIRGLAFLAQRILEILSEPEQSGCCASELFGISRLLQQRGYQDRAERLYRMALEKGLPEPAGLIAKRELALAAKRRREYTLSKALWEKLLGSTSEGLKAYEQLAMYYEHHVKEPRRAANLSREALVRLQEAYRAGRILPSQYMRLHASFRHRLARLSSKICIG